MKPMLIGVSGKAEHGKNATCNIVKEWVANNGGTAALFEISKIILDECIALGLLPPGAVRNQQDKVQNKVLVDHGNRRRAEDGLYWTNQIIKQMTEADVNVSLCPNIRFPQEGAAIQAAGGTIWRVNRLNKDGSPFVSETRDPNDVCETSLDRWASDFYLYNMTGHGALLEQQVVTLYEYVLGLES